MPREEDELRKAFQELPDHALAHLVEVFEVLHSSKTTEPIEVARREGQRDVVFYVLEMSRDASQLEAVRLAQEQQNKILRRRQADPTYR